MALVLAEIFIHNKLQAMKLTHLHVRTQSNSLIIYSMEQNEESYRAVLTHTPGNDYVISIVNPRGNWQLIPFVGQLVEMMDLLIEKLIFALAKWSDGQTG